MGAVQGTRHECASARQAGGFKLLAGCMVYTI